MVDYVLEAIKIALIEDGAVSLKNQLILRRVDIPEHEHRMPNGDIIIVPLKSKVRLECKEKFINAINNGEIEEIDHGDRQRY